MNNSKEPLVVKARVSLEMFIPFLPKTPNQMLRRHWTVVMNEKKQWHNLVAFYSPRYDGKPMQKAKLIMTRRSSRQPDFDGLVGSFKHVLDGIVKMKIIADDKYEVIGDSTYRWEKVKKDKQGVHVVIEELIE